MESTHFDQKWMESKNQPSNRNWAPARVSSSFIGWLFHSALCHMASNFLLFKLICDLRVMDLFSLWSTLSIVIYNKKSYTFFFSLLVIYSDEWPPYSDLNRSNYHHLTVNYQRHYIDSSTGTNTQTIEWFWQDTKVRILTKMNGIKESTFQS